MICEKIKGEIALKDYIERDTGDAFQREGSSFRLSKCPFGGYYLIGGGEGVAAWEKIVMVQRRPSRERRHRWPMLEGAQHRCFFAIVVLLCNTQCPGGARKNQGQWIRPAIIYRKNRE